MNFQGTRKGPNDFLIFLMFNLEKRCEIAFELVQSP